MRRNLILAVMFGTLALLTGGCGESHTKTLSNNRELAQYRRTYLRQTGVTHLVPGVTDYDLRSFDGGRHWYAVRTENEDLVPVPGGFESECDVIILGEAEKVYPGLLEHLAAVNEMLKYGKMTPGERDAMEKFVKSAGTRTEKK